MREAIIEAKKALSVGEIPVGAVVVREGSIIGRGHNLCENEHSAVMHAEIRAITEAAAALGDWRLNGCDIYVTLEPCVMCCGAILNCRMERLIFGAYDPEYGGAGGRIDVFAEHCLGGKAKVYGGVLEDECSSLLRSFFEGIRGS